MDALKKLHQELHEKTVRALLARIESGEATAAEMAVAVKLLKDNNITVDATDRGEGDPLRKLQSSVVENLPFTDDVVPLKARR